MIPSPIRPNYGSCDHMDEETNSIAIVTPTTRKSYGQYRTYWFKDGEPLIAIGPHWPVFLIAYCGFWALTVFMLHFETQQEASQKMYTLSLLICFVQLISYLLVSTKNPGISNGLQVTTSEDVNALKRTPSRKSTWFCMRCQAVQQPATNHCEFCQVCIIGHDHHCPWTGKCIGKYNFTEFVVFVASTCLMLAIFVVSTINNSP